MIVRLSSAIYNRYQSQYRQYKPYFAIPVTATERVLPNPYDILFRERIGFTKQTLVGKHQSLALSRRAKLQAYLGGYPEEFYEIYGFDEGVDSTEYLTEVSRRAAGYINDDPTLLDNKDQFYQYMSDIGLEEYIPEVYGQIRNGSLITDGSCSFLSLLETQGRVVIKEPGGSSGKEVYICELDDDQPVLSGKNNSHSPLEQLDEFDGYVVTEYCQQAEYVDEIYPHSANTIRAIMMDPEDAEPFIADAVHRIGTSQSSPLDNFSQFGLSVSIDLESGTLGRVAQRTADNELLWHETHPETGVQISGVQIPSWNEIKHQLIEITREMDEIRYVGWDAIITGPGELKLIEGNSRPNPRLIQVHEPLLKNKRVRQFYNEYGII